MLWTIFGVMLLAALAVVLLPLYRHDRAFSPRLAGTALTVLIVAGVTYWEIGSPGAGSVSAQADSVEEMVESLAERLEDEPDDLAGWTMLGRSYGVMGRFADAAVAFEKAVELENSSNGQTLAELGEALFLADNSTLQGRAGQLFENSLALTPGNAKALFYSGLAAAGRGDTTLAAERWEQLLATSPPPEVEQVLRARIAEWRGEMPQPAVTAAPVADGLELSVDVGFGDNVVGLDAANTVFVIARDPAQPGPPIAVARRKLAELPGVVTLSDANAMLPGRPLSAFQQIEIVVRISASGQPMAQPGDWFGTATLDVTQAQNVAVTVDRQQP